MIEMILSFTVSNAIRLEMGEEVKCRFQYINDLDPFLAGYNREPIKPLQYSVSVHKSVAEFLPVRYGEG